MPKSRIEAFTDAVIAIIMTLLVLELHEPDAPTWSAFLQMGHKFIVYLISFVSLAIYWNNHHHLFQLVHRIDGRVLWANNFLILMMTLFPYVTAWVGDYPFEWAPQALYGFVTFGTDLAYYLLVQSLIRANGKESKIGKLFYHYPKSYLSIGMALLALLLGKMIAPIAVLIVNVLILLMWVVPERVIEKTL